MKRKNKNTFKAPIVETDTNVCPVQISLEHAPPVGISDMSLNFLISHNFTLPSVVLPPDDNKTTDSWVAAEYNKFECTPLIEDTDPRWAEIELTQSPLFTWYGQYNNNNNNNNNKKTTLYIVYAYIQIKIHTLPSEFQKCNMESLPDVTYVGTGEYLFELVLFPIFE